MAEDCVGPAAEQAAATLQPGEVLLLENLRYHAEEEKNEPHFFSRMMCNIWRVLDLTTYVFRWMKNRCLTKQVIRRKKLFSYFTMRWAGAGKMDYAPS